MTYDMLDTKWNSYVYRHFDDYWVNEMVDSKVYDQFTEKEYNQYLNSVKKK